MKENVGWGFQISGEVDKRVQDIPLLGNFQDRRRNQYIRKPNIDPGLLILHTLYHVSLDVTGDEGIDTDSKGAYFRGQCGRKS